MRWLQIEGGREKDVCGWEENENGIEEIKGSDSSLNMPFCIVLSFRTMLMFHLLRKQKTSKIEYQ